ncbi:uncharacterized protein LOC110984425 [Acanthaster planci]|uniref:Uncharacterized protein LOC110984425 n=1 Tax=Acanthaster planci TaxID=133434 RepID=A0A8B7ZAP2_ACAPL|nr:uncharacterized protein LOC110984425 [Acanthaster planci]
MSIDTPTNSFLSHSDSLAVHWNYFDDESGIESFQLAIYEIRHGNKRKIFPMDPNPRSFELISDITARSHVQSGLTLRPGALYVTQVKAKNQAKLVASHETSGIMVDPSPPVMRYIYGGNLDGEAEEIFSGYLYQNSRSTIQASWLAADGQSGIKNYWVTVGTAPCDSLDPSTCSDEAFTEGCRPVYYVCVKSENGAGAFSDVICSSPIRVVDKDQAGYVTDGPSILQDIDAQKEKTTVTIWFDEFESSLHGISHYEWAVGTTPGGEDIQPLTSAGIVPGNDKDIRGLAGRGKAQSPLPLQHGVTYYSTLRAITNGDNVLEATSNGFTVDITPPEIVITGLGQYDARVNLSLDGGVNLYQSNTDSVDAMWDVQDGESDVTATYFYMGQYPGSDNVYPITSTDRSYIPSALVRPAPIGIPNILSVQAVNSVGSRRTVHSTGLTVDNTPPSGGQVQCPAFIHADSILLCSWTGFLDAESGIDHYSFLVGTAQGLSDAYQSGTLPGYLTRYSVRDMNLAHNQVYYATVEAFNAINQSTMAFSAPIKIDDTPPSYGLVVELPGIHTFNFSDPMSLPELDCTNQEECLLLDGECLESLTQLQILWQPFTDGDTQITKYEVALGTTPGGSQVKPFYEVSKDQTSELITNIDLSDIRKVYATVRGYNEAGLTSTAVSNGIFVSRFSAGLQPLRPFQVKDGVSDNELGDMDFQTSLHEMSAAWDFSGDPCPITKYEWAIYRVDNQEIQPFTNVQDQTSDTNTDVEMTDGETYYSIVRATNALGLAITVRSDGITVKREPLIPGQVYDGLLVGFDLTYQKETDTISASWRGFGQGMPVKETVHHTGNAEIARDLFSEQSIDYYEAAVGTDPRYPKTRDNVVPFTHVGLNTTVTFTNLDLTVQDSTYYVTVRAYSVNFATAEVTSTGISVGIGSTVHGTEVEVPKYVNSVSEVQIMWGEYESTLPILFYYAGLGEPSPSSIPPEDMDCLDMLLGTKEAQATFSKRQMRFVGKDTYVDIRSLSLTQEDSYYVTVVGVNEGGECNSSTSYFTVDVTPPLEGRLRGGPFYDMAAAYTDSTDSVSVAWEGYRDDESGIKSFNLRLMQAASCDIDDDNNLTPLPNQDWLVLSPDTRDFTFVALSLATNQPYYAQMSAVNNAGGSIQSQFGPIFVDSSEPTAGMVVDGMDFMMDVKNSKDRNQVSGTILHLPNPVGPSCPMKDIPFTDPHWSAMDFKGLLNMKRDKWDLEYKMQQVSASNESLTLKMERDTRGPRMLSGAYVTNAQIVRSSEYEFDLKAAPPDLHSVTSILFWDGPDGTIGDFDFGGRENWQEGICQCCYQRPFNQSMCPQCDCQDFLGILDSSEDNSMYASTTNMPPVTTASEFTSSGIHEQPEVTSSASLTTLTSRPWAIRRQNEDGDSVSNDENAGLITQRACGFQLYPNGSASQAVMWCRYFKDGQRMSSQPVDLDFDPSVEERHYAVSFRSTPFDAHEDEWSFDVLIDGKLLASLTGIPVMSSSTKLILHVFNRDSYIADLQDPFNPPVVTATLRNFKMPPEQSKLCRYGAPFRAGTNPVSRYFAGVGSEAGATDIVPFKEIARPCVPCIHPCDRYQCDPSCSVDAVPITFTLTNLTLPRLEILNVTVDDDTNATVATSQKDGGSLPFFLTVKFVLGNGKLVSASSNGFYVDETPAELDVFFYVDLNVSRYKPTWYQSSESTISCLWSFIDMESLVKEHYWAIGTSRGARDLQDFVNVGLNQTATNSDLKGLLHHNTTYYVTLKAVNGAGLETIVECDGVTVLLEEPTADDVNTNTMFSEKFEEEVYPPDVEKSEDPTKTGTSWSKPGDESIISYEYCVSSSAELLDDVVPCMVVGGNSSGSVAIENGKIVVQAGDREERFNITDFQIPKESTHQVKTGAKFNMEPGKCLHTSMRMCNAAQLCKIVPSGTTMVLGKSDQVLTSHSGTDLILMSTTVHRRKKRATDNHFDVTVATTGGLHVGGSLILGLLDVNRTNQEFTSDASPDYKPYITNPLYTIQYTSRLLRQRIRFVYEPTFYISSLGQIELQGPLVISLTLRTLGNWTEAKPRLIYWDTDHSEWRDAAKTCSDVDRITYLNGGNQVNVEVCSTRAPASSPSAAGRKRRAVQEEPVPTSPTRSYFSHETQFALAVVLDTIPNSPPVITNFIEKMIMNEDEGTLVYTFQAIDAEDDVLVFELGSNEDLQGTATITEDGEFSYTPCADCYGIFNVHVTVRELQIFTEREFLSTGVDITIEVQPVNDNPVLYSAQNSQVVGNGRIALVN